MVFAALLVFFLGATTGAVIDHEYPEVGNTITQDHN